MGVQVTDSLPLIEDVSELAPRSPQEVATRAIVVGYLMRFAFGCPVKQVSTWLGSYSLQNETTAGERELLDNPEPKRQAIVDTTWQIEGVQCLAWCLGLSDLDHTKECPETLASLFPEPDQSPKSFIRESELRPFEELFTQADLLYRIHWATREARLRGHECPLKESIIGERRRAIDWVIGVGPDWDNMPMST